MRLTLLLAVLLLPVLPSLSQSLDSLFFQADQAKREKDWKQVEQISSTIVHAHPQAGRAWYRLGVAEENRHHLAQAEEAFVKAADLHYMEDDCLFEAALLAGRLNRSSFGLIYLKRLAARGFDQPSRIQSAQELASLHQNAEYKNIVSRVEGNIRMQASNPQWSQDDKHIIFERGASNFPPSKAQVFSVELSTGIEKQLTFDATIHMMPDFSPDNRSIVFVSEDGGQRKLFIEDLETHHRRKLIVENIGNEHFPSWSPDGKQIVFNADGKGRRQIYVVKIDGSGLSPLSDTTSNSDYGRWTSEGRITFESDRAGMWDAYIMDRDGAQLTRLAWASTPSLSKTGQLLFSNNVTFGNAEICLNNLNGATLKRLTSNHFEDWEPAWSHQGRRIVFMSKQTGHFDLYLMAVDGTGVKRLTHTPQR